MDGTETQAEEAAPDGADLANELNELRDKGASLEKAEEVAPDGADPANELIELRDKCASLEKEREAWLEEREALQEEVETLKNRCQKLMRQAAKPEVQDAESQTEAADAEANGTVDGEAASFLPPVVEEMLRKPKDEELQLRCVQALFETQTAQADSSALTTSSSALRGSLEAAVAIFNNHPSNRQLCLKASQFLSVLLAEPNAEEQLPLAVLFQAAQDVVSIGGQLLADVASGGALEAGATPSPSKLLTWFLSLLALLLPCLGSRLKDRAQGEAFLQDLLSKLVGPLLAPAELPQEALILKCVQLLPLLPMEPWIQKACLESGAVHGLALAYRRCAGGFAPPARGSSVGDATDAPLPKAVRAAVRWVFMNNLEICVRAMEDTFVDDAFICLEVLEELKGAEKKQRGTFVALDTDHGLIEKALGLWTHHQRRALEDSDNPKNVSRDVLLKVTELLRGVLLKLPPQRLLLRMQEFQSAEVLQRIALATINGSAQLRLQLAVNYLDNDVIKVVIACMQMLLHHYEVDVDNPPSEANTEIEAAFKLLQDDTLPAEGWPYVNYCLDVCIHVLSHWSATKASLRQKAEVLDKRAAPLCLAHAGLVDVLVELVDPAAAGFELTAKPPQAVLDKATETLKALFEQNGHICLFCMQHYTEVRQMVELGCVSLISDPLVAFPQLQRQAVVQLAESFEKFAYKDEKLGRRIRKALAALFESSYRLVSWFLQQNPIGNLADFQSLDVHTEAVRAVARAPYWSSEDAHLLPEFVALITQLLMNSIEGAGPDDAPSSRSGRRVLDLTEAEEVVAGCISAVLHLLLIDPSPPTVLQCLAKSLAQCNNKGGTQKPDEDSSAGSEQAVNAVMRVMQVFPSSDRVQTNCHLLLTSLLGE